MKPELDFQTLSLNRHSKQPAQLTAVNTNEFDEQKPRELNQRPVWTTVQPSVDTDEFGENDKKKGLNLRPVLRAIRRNVLLITGITTVLAATAVYSGSKSLHSYEGDFRLLVEPITSEARATDPSVLSRQEGGSTTTNTIDYPTLLQLLQSPGLLSGIAKRIQARYPDVSYDSLTKDLVVQRVVGASPTDSTKLIEVRYKGADPKKVQFVLDEVAKGYLKYSLEDRKTRIGSGVQFIEDQLPRLQQQVDGLEAQLQGLQQRYKLSDPESEGAGLSNQLREIQAQKLETQRQLREQKTLYANLQKQLKLAPNEVIAASTLSEDPNYQDLIAQVKKIESQIAVESARFNEDSPVIQSLRDKQKNLSLLLKQETGKIVGQNLPSKAASPQALAYQNSIRQDLIKQLVDTANQSQVLEVRNQAVTQAEASLDRQVRQFPAIARQHNDLQRRLEIATKTLNQLLLQRETLRVEAAQKEVPWELVSDPNLPRDAAGNPIPVADSNTKKLAMAVIAGLVLGLGGALLREKSRKVFYASEDTQDATKLPLLGLIPFDKRIKKLPLSAATVGAIEETEVNHYNTSSLEAFNALYTSIRFLPTASPVQSLVVSSAAPRDGKTTIALHLAQAAALMGQRVLLVDANLRLPQLHTKLGLPNLQGLSNLLSQNLAPNDAIQRSPLQENLFVLTSGQHLPESSSLLGSPKMQHLMQQFKAAFDLVIYDTPHLLNVPDAKFLAANTDGILMVVGVRKTNRTLVMQVLNQLNTFHLPVLGVVTNYVRESTTSSYGYPNHYYEQNPRLRPTLQS